MAPVPTVARVDSLSHWTNLFHPTTGAFRLPSTSGETIEHLDIDLRFVHCDFTDPSVKAKDEKVTLLPTGGVHLPKVCLLTLRGAEHCQDSDEAMDALAEVLGVIHPVEVRWLNASNDPSEQLTFATHLVHDAIILAGQQWAIAGCLRKLVIQGGFPCPNLTAPTPFTLTPATTPASSPGPNRMTFGSLASALPSLSTTKPKPRVIDEDRLKARAERKRLADYTLKPRFEFALGSWGAEEIVWRLDGRYTAACIKSIVEHLFRALQKTWPYPSARCEFPLPSLVAFTPLSPSAVSKIRSLPDSLELSDEIKSYLEDTFFFATEFESAQHARLFEPLGQPSSSVEDREQQTRRFKAEMLLIKSGHNELVEFTKLIPELPASISSSESGSPPGTAQQAGFNIPGSSSSPGSMPSNMTDGESEEDEGVAMTPDLGMSLVMDGGMPAEPEQRKKVETIPTRQGSWGI